MCALISEAQKTTNLVRYGQVPEVARFNSPPDERVHRGDLVVVQTHRGLQVGTLLEQVPIVSSEGAADHPPIVRRATAADQAARDENRRRCEEAFDVWCDRIAGWQLDLQLIDLEWTLDGEKLILYVLNERGPDCTKLALQAAAGGFGIIEVQPIDGEGIVQAPEPAGGGCGSGGCGCG